MIGDLDQREGIRFAPWHALYLKAIHGGKTENDAIDARKSAGLLRGGLLPAAYAYPAARRSRRQHRAGRCGPGIAAAPLG